MSARIDFCGESYDITAHREFSIGREGDLAIDDNPYLHRRFLGLRERDGMVWLANVGTQLTATVSDENGLMQAWLAPGARVPLVFPRSVVWFTAGPTTYEFDVLLDVAPFVPAALPDAESGATTVGRVSFTPDQRLLILALAENLLRRGNRGSGSIPTSAEAAARLGWTITKFNRKLDNVCQKLSRTGIRGLHGDAEKLATNRRARLVEYCLAARLITADDLDLLDALS